MNEFHSMVNSKQAMKTNHFRIILKQFKVKDLFHFLFACFAFRTMTSRGAAFGPCHYILGESRTTALMSAICRCSVFQFSFVTCDFLEWLRNYYKFSAFVKTHLPVIILLSLKNIEVYYPLYKSHLLVIVICHVINL